MRPTPRAPRSLRPPAARLALVAPLLLAACADGARPESVLLISLDTVRADRLGYAGGRDGVSPSVDALAAESLAFEDAWSPRGQTWPALASLLTGRWPLSHGVRSNGLALPSGVPTLAELCGRRGMRTGAFLANACEAWGSERFDELWCGRSEGETKGDQSRLQARWDERVTERAIEWMRSSPEPFLCWVHLFDAHKPWPTVDALRERFLDPGYEGALRPRPGEASERHEMPFHAAVDAIARSGAPPAPADLEAMRAVYDAGVFGVDRRVGELVGALAADGALERTLVVLTADHGEELLDHASYPYHGAAIHGSTLRVPLLLRFPRGLPPARVEHPVSLVDVAPTVLSLLGVEPPADMDGSDLTRTLAEGWEPPPRLSEMAVVSFSSEDELGVEDWFAIESGGWRLVWNPARLRCHHAPFEEEGLLHPSALYDRRRDPTERDDRLAEEPERAAALRAELERLLAPLRARERLGRPPALETLELLEDLGYLEAR